MTKQLLLNDNGIQDLLSMMDRLDRKEMLLVNAQNYKINRNNAGDLKLLVDGQKERRHEDEVKRWRKVIADALRFPESALGADGEPIPVWQTAYEARKNALVDDTGKWIQDLDVFSDWAKAPSPQKPILVLEGSDGTGKTSAMANIVRSFRSMNSSAPTARSVVAYYFPNADRDKEEDAQPKALLASITRALLWQIATSYETMTKAMAQVAEKSTDFANLMDTWRQLFTQNRERRNIDTTYYIFIDGIEDHAQELMPLFREFSKDTDGKGPRVFVSARFPTVAAIDASTNDVVFNSIRMSDFNSDDIEKYINFRMDNMAITKNPSQRPGVQTWRQKILTTLQEKCEGDYFRLNKSLDMLSNVDLVEDIMLILQDAGKDRVDQIKEEICRLNMNRTVKEIQEINDIIMWIQYGKAYFSVDWLEILLSVPYRSTLPMHLPGRVTARQPTNELNDGLTTVTSAERAVSLLPFSEKLRDKYPLFKISDWGTIDWRSKQYQEYIPRSKRGDDRQGMGGVGVVLPNEIDIVRHFLSTVCPPELYGRFEFEQFFQAKKMTQSKNFICQDDENAHLRITLACLTILTDVDFRNIWKLRSYAVEWILDHMKAVNLAVADQELKSRAGPMLLMLFTHEHGIDSMFWPHDLNISMKNWRETEYPILEISRSEWVYSLEGMREISRWFADSSVTKHISSGPSAELTALMKTQSADAYEAYMSHAAIRMAEHLFCAPEFTKRQFQSGCSFLRGFLARVSHVELGRNRRILLTRYACSLILRRGLKWRISPSRTDSLVTSTMSTLRMETSQWATLKR
jgi:hypothetical protein